MSADRDIRYADPSHAAFNKRFEPHKPMPDHDVTGPWLKPEIANALPKVRSAFDTRRGTPVTIQPPEQSQATVGDTGRGSTMVKRDKPKPTLTPDGEVGKAVDRGAFRGRWLSEQRDAAFARADALQARRDAERQPEHAPAPTLHPTVPSL